MKKITIFGGSGNTGTCIIEESLKLGLDTTVLVRDPARILPELKDKVTVVVGDVLNLEDVEKAMEGADGVAVALGTRSCLDATTVMSDGLKNILKVMEMKNVKTVSVCISAFLLYDEDKIPPRYLGLTDDHRRMMVALESCKLDYIAVLPPHITDYPKSGYVVAENEIPQARAVSKRDLADFLVTSLSAPQYFRKRIGISSN